MFRGSCKSCCFQMNMHCKFLWAKHFPDFEVAGVFYQIVSTEEIKMEQLISATGRFSQNINLQIWCCSNIIVGCQRRWLSLNFHKVCDATPCHGFVLNRLPHLSFSALPGRQLDMNNILALASFSLWLSQSKFQVPIWHWVKTEPAHFTPYLIDLNVWRLT